MIKLIKDFISAVTRLNEMQVADNVKHQSPHNTNPSLKVSLYHALNGRILEIATHSTVKQGSFSHSDWEYEFYYVGEGETLSTAIATAFTLKELAK
jgi:hypothetical protein